MKNSADLGGCYQPRPSASVDNTLLYLQNSSYPTQPHSIIAKYYPTFDLGFLDDFEDLENVSEMVAETSEASKAKVLPVKTTRARARVTKSAVSENNTCTCRICNLISAKKATSQREKCLAML